MKHQIFEPSSELRSFVKCYWTLESPKEDTPSRNTIVPDGCMKLIFHYGDLYHHISNSNSSIPLPRCFLIGQLTQPFEVQPAGETGTFFVCFHPEGFLPFSTLPIKEMANTAFPLKSLFGKAGLELENQILTARGSLERINIVEAFLSDRLAKSSAIEHVVKSTVETVLTASGRLSVEDLCSTANINRRQLARKFYAVIGLSPKQLSKIIKLQATLKMLMTQDVESLTTLAYQGEYYDQAHFIKDFKEFTGLTPKEFYGEQLKMSLIFDRKDKD